MPKRKNLWHTNQRYKSKVKRAQELPEQTMERMLNQREYQRKRLQNETLAEREQRLQLSRWRAAQKRNRETYKARERRIQEKRLQEAMIRSQREQEEAMVTSLLPTGLTFETTMWRNIRDQLHRSNAKIIRLSATTIKHVHVDPSSTNDNHNTSASVTDELVLMPLFSCPMQDGLDSEEEAFMEPKCVLNELNVPPNSGPMVSAMDCVVKLEPITTDEEADIIVGDLDVPCKLEPRIAKLSTTHQPMLIENKIKKINSEMGIPLKLEQKTDLCEKVEEPLILKSEIIIKSEVETVAFVCEP